MGCQLGDATTPARSATWGGGRPACGLACFFRPLGRNPKKLRARGDDGGRAQGARRAREPPARRARRPGAIARIRRARGRAFARSSGRARPPAPRGAETIDRSHGGFYRRCGVRRRIPVQHAPPPTVSRRPPPRGSRPCRGRRRARWKPCARTSVSRARAEARVARRPTVPRAVGHDDEIAYVESVFLLWSFSHGGRLRGAGLRGHERAPKPVEPVGEEND